MFDMGKCGSEIHGVDVWIVVVGCCGVHLRLASPRMGCLDCKLRTMPTFEVQVAGSIGVLSDGA